MRWESDNNPNVKLASVISEREKLLDDAKKCVCGGREQDYGSPESSFSKIAELWKNYLYGKYPCVSLVITPSDVANMMILMKMARLMGPNPTRDSYVDIAGYAACAAEILL